jgi:putative endonuclease
MKSVDPRHEVGRRGEDLAADFFIQNGYEVIARNWKCERGELDLVVRLGDEIRLIEVKTRLNQHPDGVPFEAVTPQKLSRMGEAAARFFVAHPQLPDMPHFDVFTVAFTDGNKPELQWLKDFE